jgi:SAM-dependent methyltransferase
MNVIQGGVDDLEALVAPASFDLATIMGVLYHRGVADPAAALHQVNRALQPGGWLIWNEGVHPILARAHDAFVDSGRRFRPREMRALAQGAGFQVRFASHLLGWAFPIALTLAGAQRARQRWMRSRAAEDHSLDDRPLPRPLNKALRELTYFEWACSLRGLKLPFGVSYLLIARKKTP